MLGLLDRIVGLRDGERPMVWLLFAQYFFTGCASALTQATGFALFLASFPASQLPYTFIIMSVVISSLTTLYLQLGRITGFARMLQINLLGQMLITGFFAVGLMVGGTGNWLTFCLPVLFQIVIVFGNMAFWSLAGRMLNVQQGKRLFGVLGTGEWLAMVTMGIAVPGLVRAMGLPSLLWLAVAAMAVALLFMGFNIERHRHLLADDGEAPAASAATPAAAPPRLLSLFANRYVLVIFCLIMVWWIGFFFVDNIFYDAAARQFPDGEALAGFLGLYLSIVGVLTVISNLFIAGPVVSRFGLRASLVALPAGLLAGSVIMAATGLLSGPMLLLFVAAVGTKIWSVGLGFSVDQAARSILVQPFSPWQRTRVQTLVDGVAQPVATGTAGLLLLLLGWIAPGQSALLVYGLLVAAIAHIVIVEMVSRGYANALVAALNTRRLIGTELSLNDPTSRAVLVKALDHAQPGAVTYAMRMLASVDAEQLATHLPRLLERPDRDVRRYALETVGSLGLGDLKPALRRFVTTETAADLTGLALRILARLGDAAPALQHIDDARPVVRRLAMAGAIDGGGAAAERVRPLLRRLVSSADATERELAAQVIGENPAAAPGVVLATLLGDKDLAVRRAAIRATARASDAAPWAAVIEAAGQRATRNMALAALAAGGQPALDAIGTALQRTSLPTGQRASLARAAGRSGRVEAAAILLPLLDHPHTGVRSAAVAALGRCHYRLPASEAARLAECMQLEAGQAARVAAAQRDLGDDPAVALVQAALAAQLDETRGRVLGLLALAADAPSIARAADNLHSADAAKRAYALEVIDIATPVALKPLMLPVVETLTPGERLRRLAGLAPQAGLNREDRLRDMALNGEGIWDDWTQVSALFGLRQIAPDALPAPDALRSAGPVVADFLATLAGRATSSEGAIGMLSTVEKVIMLRSAGIFTETADDVLADVAAIATDSTARAGETVLKKGDAGDSMYVIAAGRVKVHDGERHMAELGPGEPFGEMALIDPEPRSASVTALEETRLIRIDQQAFFELVDERPEVARGLLRVLSRRLRNMS